MDLMLVVSLILALVFTRQGLIEATEQVQDLCLSICLPGTYKVGSCENGKHLCKQCSAGTFTAINNTIERCLRCSPCAMGAKKQCTTTSNVVCKCKDGSFYQNAECENCSTANDFDNEDFMEMCSPCRRTSCMGNPECKKKCNFPPNITAKMSASTASTTPKSGQIPSTPLKTLNPTENKAPKDYNLFVWLSFVAAIFLVLFWFLLLFCRNLLRNEHVLPCWTTKKDLARLPQEPSFNEQRSHHCGSPTTLAFAFSEETPMMPLCQEPSAHINGHMQRGVHSNAKRYEQCNRWPAIVLYAIIKEVPLRRWKEFLRLLAVPDQQMERVELETCLGSIEKQYQMLRLWSQRSSASLSDVYSSLHHMDLSGCAQQLQENLERLEWRPEEKQGLTV
ncbi:tumor necrosis factor receptor superfamily member 1A isoform X2 [Girardinichthys multiradiatus]|uniref:tumor necrosis factor receptor superfamily member 1A isoform X2 n=1 Tax=Girardinichthys multiradiatus TaxID=208333 RepID=UPI001FAD4C58|nr:tumor necrosis factor receptor superfamily member 1A isoform X2 [Girardinichthys multiradiatus]